MSIQESSPIKTKPKTNVTTNVTDFKQTEDCSNKPKTVQTNPRLTQQTEDCLNKPKTNTTNRRRLDVFLHPQLVPYLFQFLNLFDIYSCATLNTFWITEMKKITNTLKKIFFFFFLDGVEKYFVLNIKWMYYVFDEKSIRCLSTANICG